MDVSQVQSESRQRSDFSIERILSEDTRAREDTPASPSWLCCTRYQPPRIPRAGGSGSRSRRAGRHARVPFTAAQASALEAAYARAPYLAPPALRALAAALHLRDDRIKIWFQNRRARERREKCASISPPQAMTLPPTKIGATAAYMTGLADCSAYSHDISSQCVSSLSSIEINRSFSHFTETLKIERPETPLDIESIENDENV